MSDLTNRRIVVTRAARQAGELADLLRERGATPVLYPCIEIAPPVDPSALDAALHKAATGGFDMLVLTSTNTVLALAERVEALRLASAFTGMQVAAIGPATARAARQSLGLIASTVPDHYDGDSLSAALDLPPQARVFLPQSALADGELTLALARKGAAVDHVVAYRTVTGSGGEDVPTLLKDNAIDAISFTSASTVTHFMERLRADGGERRTLDFVCAACIGAKTAATARLEFPVVVEAEIQTLTGLLDALESYFA